MKILKAAVIGKDVSKSVSPQMHGFIAEALGKKIEYGKISIPETEFESAIEGVFENYDCFNVTIPYKLSVIPHLKKTVGDAQIFRREHRYCCGPHGLQYRRRGLRAYAPQ